MSYKPSTPPELGYAMLFWTENKIYWNTHVEGYIVWFCFQSNKRMYRNKLLKLKNRSTLQCYSCKCTNQFTIKFIYDILYHKCFRWKSPFLVRRDEWGIEKLKYLNKYLFVFNSVKSMWKYIKLSLQQKNN